MSEHQGDSRLIIFSDFDGTVTRQDVGNRLFHHFSDGKSEGPVALWRADKIDSRQCLLDEATLMRPVTQEELYQFIDSFAVDPGFEPFVRLCRSHGVPLYILSDGLELYIKRLLSIHNLSSLSFFTNHADLIDGHLQISFPFGGQGCGRCGNCKGYHIQRLRKAGQTVVYIGDGKSDLCAVPHADLIFAKDFLAAHCRENSIDFEPYDDFTAIAEYLKNNWL